MVADAQPAQNWYAVSDEVKFYSELVNNAYAKEGGSPFARYVYYNDWDNATPDLRFVNTADATSSYAGNLASPVLFHNINGYEDMEIYVPYERETATGYNPNIYVVFKGSTNFWHFLLDAGLFADFTTITGENSYAYQTFERNYKLKIDFIKTRLFDNPQWSPYKKVFISHSLGAMYSTKIFHELYQTYPTQLESNITFNPYLLPDDRYEAIVTESRTDATLKNKYTHYCSQYDPASAIFLNHGYGNVRIYDSKNTTTYIGNESAFAAAVVAKTYLSSQNHTIYQWSDQILPPQAMNSMVTENYDHVYSLRTFTPLPHIDSPADATSQTVSEATYYMITMPMIVDYAANTRTHNPNGIINYCDYPYDLTIDINHKYHNTVFKRLDSHHAMFNKFLWQGIPPEDEINPRRKWFSPVVEVVNQTQSYSDINYFLFYRVSITSYIDYMVLQYEPPGRFRYLGVSNLDIVKNPVEMHHLDVDALQGIYHHLGVQPKNRLTFTMQTAVDNSHARRTTTPVHSYTPVLSNLVDLTGTKSYKVKITSSVTVGSVTANHVVYQHKTYGAWYALDEGTTDANIANWAAVGVGLELPWGGQMHYSVPSNTVDESIFDMVYDTNAGCFKLTATETTDAGIYDLGERQGNFANNAISTNPLDDSTLTNSLTDNGYFIFEPSAINLYDKTISTKIRAANWGPVATNYLIQYPATFTTYGMYSSSSIGATQAQASTFKIWIMDDGSTVA